MKFMYNGYLTDYLLDCSMIIIRVAMCLSTSQLFVHGIFKSVKDNAAEYLAWDGDKFAAEPKISLSGQLHQIAMLPFCWTFLVN